MGHKWAPAGRGEGKSRRSSLWKITKNIFSYIGCLFATFFSLWRAFCTMWGPFCCVFLLSATFFLYVFFCLYGGPFLGEFAPPPSPTEISAGAHGGTQVFYMMYHDSKQQQPIVVEL